MELEMDLELGLGDSEDSAALLCSVGDWRLVNSLGGGGLLLSLIMLALGVINSLWFSDTEEKIKILPVVNCTGD